MIKKARQLSSKFIAGGYQLTVFRDKNMRPARGLVRISGQKTGPPSKRLTFNQKGLKITSAKIIFSDKKGKITEFRPIRINHHRRFEEVRLHTNEPMYSGNYEVAIDFIYQKPVQVKKALPMRECFPAIDEPGSLDDFDVTYIDD